jgi:adenylate cyclase
MEHGVEPVPIALAVYAVFVGWRLRCAYARRLSLWFMILSAAIDIAVLMGAIWSFTLQYNEPATLYLKAPTLLYVFILIALRALKFDPRQVLAAGLFAAFGWIVLVLVAARGANVTSDYRIYMTSLSLLWGAEAEKVTAILAVTAVLALAVARSRSLLISTNIESSAAHQLSRFLDRGAAERVRSADNALQPGDGELKQAAILFLDLRGFSSAAAKLTPREVIAILEDYQRRFVPIIEAAGGSIDTFMGDGILVSFGTSRITGRESAEALGCLPAILAAAGSWADERAAAGLPPLAVAAAFAAGPVVHGVIGAADRLEFTVIGDAVNLAAKLEKHAKVERARALCTLETLERARAQGLDPDVVRLSRGASVDGVAEPIDLAILA